MGSPLFSFIMPAYKRRFIADAIGSILSQTYSDFELVVVNDASPDDLREAVSHFRDQRLRYEENAENIGGRDLVANWNHCLQYARGEYVVLATDDDVAEPAYLADAVRLLKKYPTADLLRQGVRKIGPGGEQLEYELFPKEHLSASEFAYFWGCCGLISCISNFVFRREPLLRMGGFVSFPHAHFSDVATALAMSRNGVACVQAYNTCFRMSDINLSNRGDWRLALEQIKASGMFMKWLEAHLASSATDFYAQRAFCGFRGQYRHVVGSLVNKIPAGKLPTVLAELHRSDYLYKKEKLRMLFDYML